MKKTIFFSLMIFLLLAGSVCFAFAEENSGGDEGLYNEAYSLYEDKKYYDAHELFIQSQFGDWERMAKKCERRWPKNGEIWHDPTQWLRDTKLTFVVDQPANKAIFIKLYKDGALVYTVFVGGKDEVSIMVPGNGVYTIQDGVGSTWYGPDDAFGPKGGYETMTFGSNDDPEIHLDARYEYKITINVRDAVGEDIGSDDLKWENF